MYFKLFAEDFPQIAGKETRRLDVLEDGELPKGTYYFSNSYCTDKHCDCRRTIIQVLQIEADFNPVKLAAITYGWETKSFYTKWGGALTAEDIVYMKGPALEPISEQSEYASVFLKFFTNVLLQDESYKLRLQRHYAYTKRKQGMKLPKELNRLVKTLDPCPCESGKNFRMCCGKMRKVRRK